MDPDHQMMTPEIYMQSCAWPEDMPVFYGRGEHFGVAEDDERTASDQGDGHEYMDDDVEQ